MLLFSMVRVAWACVTALLVAVFMALIVNVLPGDPVKMLVGPRADEATVARVREEMGLDLPVAQQVWNYLSDAVRLDFGRDFVNNMPVADGISAALPHTLVLALSAIFLAGVFGILLGVVASCTRHWLVRSILNVMTSIGLSMPTYVVGLLLLLVFSVQLRLFPATGTASFDRPLEYLRTLTLPTLAVSFFWICYVSKLLEANLEDAMASPFVRVARANGVPGWKIRFKYALKTAAIPLVSLLGVSSASLVGGAVFAELIFSRPGIGSLIVSAIEVRNFPIVRGGVMTLALLCVATNLFADLLYRFIDPKIKVGAANE
ncbi:ABC transporter permease [Agrobacterium sp. ICMP 6402]|uniref:ABC transporter permease n=1 Tax=Agrobacterium sp. ICMP 6402 TaxID=2292443 RepID=UPI0012953FBE|nr:ABC transporter permease [Agrobacterium sp. ICMP 6402]MQB12408.1 ABC transporter permease [Agrobacterium sp. ICMP 6402]